MSREVAWVKHMSVEIVGGAKLLSQALRAIRKKRGLTAQTVANAMDLPKRTYDDFEAGRGLLTQERVFAFADATNCDPYALILGTIFQLPEFAINCADTKLALILMMHLREFAEDQGDDITYLDPGSLIGGFERVFKDLTASLADREAFLQNWLDNRTGWIGLDALRLRGVRRRARKS
jgi:transcriptional regulator with XRE-family HTH domain